MPMNPTTDLWLMKNHLADSRYSHAITSLALSQLGRNDILLSEGWYDVMHILVLLASPIMWCKRNSDVGSRVCSRCRLKQGDDLSSLHDVGCSPVGCTECWPLSGED